MTNATTISPLRQRMIEDMTARGLGRQTQRGHILACKRFAAYLKRSPDTATAEDVRLFQLHLMESGLSIQTRNRTMTGVRFLLRVTMRRHDLAAEVFHMKAAEDPADFERWRGEAPSDDGGQAASPHVTGVGFSGGGGASAKRSRKD